MTTVETLSPTGEVLKPFAPERGTPIDFAQEATVAKHLTLQEGSFVNSLTDEDAEDLARTFSWLKFGDPRATDFWAGEIVSAALEDENFQAFLKRAESTGKQIYIIAPEIQNLPSGSSLLMENIAGRLNVALTASKLPPVLIDHTKKLSASNPNYGNMSVEERTQIDPQTTLPDYNGHPVILVDDVYISGTVAERLKQKLYSQSGAEEVFFFFGAKVDPEAVFATNGTVEQALTDRAFDGSLDSTERLFKEDARVVQRLIRDYILNPENRDELPSFLKSLDSEDIIKLYISAANNNLGSVADGKYAPSIEIIRTELQRRDLLTEDGLLTYPSLQEVLRDEAKPRRIAVHEISDKEDLTLEQRERYSRMKYGDPEAARRIAEETVTNILNDESLRAKLEAGEKIIITSSAYGDVPTAADAVARDTITLLREMGYSIDTIKIDRWGDFSTTHYGSMTLEERKKRMSERKISLGAEYLDVVRDRTILVIDDLKATGSHEKTLYAILKDTDASEIVFSYYVSFSDKLAKTKPNTEEELNETYVKTIEDLLAFFKDPEDPELEFRINARTLKFILLTEGETEEEEATNKLRLENFFREIDEKILEKLYRASISRDAYHINPRFSEGFQILENLIIEKGIVDIDEINSLHNRTVAFNLTVDKDGNVWDIETGENANELARKYSLMKFGGVREIEEFSVLMADNFIQRLDDPNDSLLAFFKGIRDREEYISIFAPGFRNVESSSNYLIEKAVERINVALALRGLPTIIVNKLSRLESNAANYATLTKKERESLPRKTRPIYPGKEYYQEIPMHIIFGDDIRITGATADNAERVAKDGGALSTSSFYAIQIEPNAAFRNPALENYLNTLAVAGELDENIAYILNQPGFRPVQRLLRLILDPNNRQMLEGFMMGEIDRENLVKLYIGALGNDYAKNEKYSASVEILRKVLTEKGYIKDNGELA